jgi:putative peptide zinc metalloprotease protein
VSNDHAQSRTFSEAWHRVGGVRAALRTSVRAHRQMSHGVPWVVLRDILSNDWYRVTAEAYAFLSRLSMERTIDEVWVETLETHPELALTQEEVVQLIGQLNLSNLLHHDRASAGLSLFERFRKRRSKERLALWLGFLSIRIPLWDPDRFLQRTRPVMAWVLGPWGLASYALLMLAAALSLMHGADSLFNHTQGVLAPGNLVLLYVGFLIAKLVHEWGHAAVCRHFGGEVHSVGVMLLMFAPLPFVDATASWGFRSRGQRLLVGFAGVLAELAVAALAACVWANTAPGAINALAYNVIFAASVSTALFNLNPLMRFDGYHMLVDAIDVPNLFQRSRDQLKYLAQRFILGLSGAQPAARTRSEVLLLPLYGVLSVVYWLMLMSTIVFFIAHQYLDLGVALAWFLVFTAVVVPLLKLLRYLATSPQLAQHRSRSVLISLLLLLLVVGGLGGVPVAERVRVPGVVEALHHRQLYSETSGELVELLVEPGSHVKAGQLLLRMANPQLDRDLQSLQLQLQQIGAEQLRALATVRADVQPLEEQRLALQYRLAELQRQRAALQVSAPIAGIWSAADLDIARGRWVARGNPLGLVVDESAWRFVAVLPQVATHLFDDRVLSAEVRLAGQEDDKLQAGPALVLPHEQGVLPSRALGMAGGGEIAVQSSDPQGLTAAEPFFKVQALLPAAGATGPRLAHGRLGVMRITLGDRPLLAQWARGLRQFFQSRFRV